MKGLIKKIVRKLERRIFYAIFQTTRVTNDNYGWKPKQSKKHHNNPNKTKDKV